MRRGARGAGGGRQVPAGRPQGPGPNGSPNGDRKPAPGAGWWPCLHTRWPVSADKAIRGPGLRGSASQMPPTPTAPSRCPVFTSCVHAGGNTARADSGQRPEQELCRMPRSPTSPGGRSHSALGHWGRCRSCRRRRCSRRRPAPPSQVYADRGGTTPGAAPETRATPGIGGARQEASEVVRGTGLDRLQNLQRSRSRHFSAMF